MSNSTLDPRDFSMLHRILTVGAGIALIGVTVAFTPESLPTSLTAFAFLLAGAVTSLRRHRLEEYFRVAGGAIFSLMLVFAIFGSPGADILLGALVATVMAWLAVRASD